MLLSGTLADLDLARVAAMANAERASLRLELRASGGALIGSLVLKAGRVVSATAGSVRGRDALRVLMGSAGDARFELAREPLDFELSSSLASVDELGELRRVAIARPRAVGSDVDATRELRSDRSSGDRIGTDPAARLADSSGRGRVRRGRVVLEGSLTEFDLPTLLHTIGCSRQHCALEIVDGRTATGAADAAVHGAIFVKSGIVIAANAGALDGIPAVRRLIASHRRERFRLTQLANDVGEVSPLGTIGQVLLAADAPAPGGLATPPVGLPVIAAAAAERPRSVQPAGAVVMEGKLADLDVRTVLETLAATRQHARLQVVSGGQKTIGEILLKLGWIVTAQAGPLRGREAVVSLLAAPPHCRFRVLAVADGADHEDTLGSIHDVLRSIPLERPPRAEVSTKILRWTIPLSFAIGGAIVFFVTRGDAPPRPPPAAVAPAAPRESPLTVEAARPAAGAPALSPDAGAPDTPDAAAPDAPDAPDTESAGRSPDAEPDRPDASGAARPGQPGRTAAPGGPNIKNAQAAFRQLGYDPGPIDNVYGRMTRNTVLKFQRAQHLPLTGVLDEQTWSAIVGKLVPQRGRR